MLWLLLVCLWPGARAADPVTVIQLRLTYNEVHVLQMNASTEYILEFTSPEGELNAPSTVWVHSNGGDSSHPVLVTARQRAGAVTWQLPYEVESRQLFELERTLCPDDAADEPADSGCGDYNSYKYR